MAAYFAPIALATLLAILHHWGVLKPNKITLTAFALAMGVVSGIRFETAQDWPAYEQFFSNVDVSVDPLESFLRHNELPIFEIGFHFLSYAIKWLGGSYLDVSLLASVFCSLALAKLLNQLAINRFYVLAVYCSYSYLLLHFAQVRQSIAIGIFLLAIAHYIRHQRFAFALGLSLLAPLFQYSAMLYVALFLIAVKWPKNWSSLATGLIVSVPILLAVVARDFFDVYSLLAKIAVTELAQAKIEIYEDNQVTGGSGVILIIGYILAMLIFQIFRAKNLDKTQEFLFRLSVAFSAMTIILIVAFPNSYVMFSRAYVACSIVQALASASLLRYRRFAIDSIAIYGSILFSLVYFSRVFTLNADEYLPFQTYILQPTPWN